MPILDQMLQYAAQRKSPLSVLKEQQTANAQRAMQQEELNLRRAAAQREEQKYQQKQQEEAMAAKAQADATGYIRAVTDEEGNVDYSKAFKLAYSDGNIPAITELTTLRKTTAEAAREDQNVAFDIEDQNMQVEAHGTTQERAAYDISQRGIDEEGKRLENALRRKNLNKPDESEKYKAPPAPSEGFFKNYLAPVVKDLDLKDVEAQQMSAAASIAFDRLTGEEYKQSQQDAMARIGAAIKESTTDGRYNPFKKGKFDNRRFDVLVFGNPEVLANIDTVRKTGTPEQIKAVEDWIKAHPEYAGY